MKQKKLVTLCIALCVAMLVPALVHAQMPKAKAPKPGDPPQGVQAAQLPMVSCQRGGLQHAVRLYLAAQAKGDISILPLANGLGYQENMKPADVKTGFITKPLVIDKSMSLYDDSSCQTFTEIIVTDKANPYVIGTRMRVNHDKIAEIEMVTTTTGEWLFNADNYLKYSSTENWSPIPVDRRNSRDELVRGANAYLDAFLEAKTDLVPWGYPCVRTEGGMTTNQGTAADTCEAGVPAGVNIANRHFVVDEVLGSVVAFCTFGAGVQGAPDSHLFRMENGKIRFVHTLTHLKMSDYSGPTGTSADKPAPKR